MRAGAASLLALAALASPALAENPAPDPREAATAIVEALEAGLEGRPKSARAALARARAGHPAPDALRPLEGMLELVAGRPRAALARLPERPKWAVYRAIAERGAPGGLGRARSLLAKAAEAPDAPPGVHFLVALAFAHAGQAAKAHAHLERALDGAGSSLDSTWAPDPAVGLAQASLRALEGLVGEDEARVRVAERMGEAGRRAYVLEATRELPEAAVLRARALGARARALAHVAPRLAVDAAARFREAAPDDPEALVLSAEIALAADDLAAAKAALAEVKGAPREVKARLPRAKARLALREEDSQAALRAARAAARADPKSTIGRGLLVEALLAAGEPERAAEIAEDLLRRRPLDVNPFALLRAARAAQKRTRKLRDLELRAEAFDAALAGRDKLVAHAEKVFAAVRDADAGLGAAGLTGLRGQDPRFGLPIDLALARHGPSGVARAARDRLLAACGARLGRLLSPDGPPEQVDSALSPYGRAREVKVPLSAADPFRCRPQRPGVGRRRETRR